MLNLPDTTPLANGMPRWQHCWEKAGRRGPLQTFAAGSRWRVYWSMLAPAIGNDAATQQWDYLRWGWCYRPEPRSTVMVVGSTFAGLKY